MSSRVDTAIPPGQTYAIKQVGKARDQDFRRKRSPAVRDRKDEEKKKVTEQHKLAGSKKGRVRYDETNGGVGSEEQHSDCGKKSKKKNDSKIPGTLVDVVV